MALLLICAGCQTAPTPTEDINKIDQTPEFFFPEEFTGFDACGKTTDYSDYEWFEDFKGKLESTHGAELEPGNWTWEKSESCLSLEGNRLITILDFKTLTQYDTQELILWEAKTEFKPKDGIYLSEFLKREGEVIPILGKYGDAGVSGNQISSYLYKENRVKAEYWCIHDLNHEFSEERHEFESGGELCTTIWEQEGLEFIESEIHRTY